MQQGSTGRPALRPAIPDEHRWLGRDLAELIEAIHAHREAVHARRAAAPDRQRFRRGERRRP